ncbi:FIST signal transduction protein [Rhizomonospora bruguierae]|uniref:FIST signal transduction protein n=1 Tax=Rhizomonospora bruguierae TaxID=1581705 RepID=UPI001BD01E5C|nr:FIST N-terminal domain-containing protein [Micromonospora sp. NBRC 107566]
MLTQRDPHAPAPAGPRSAGLATAGRSATAGHSAAAGRSANTGSAGISHGAAGTTAGHTAAAGVTIGRTDAGSAAAGGGTARCRAGVGTSAAPDATAAGRTAAAAALAALGTGTPALIVVYASVRYRLADLLAGVRSITGEAPLVGATSSGHFANGALAEPGEGVAVLALSAGPYRFGVASATGLRADAFGAGLSIARAARAAAEPGEAPHSAVLLFADGMAGNQQTLLNGVHRVAGSAVPVAGGAAGDDRRLAETFVFHDGAALADGAVAVWINSPHPLDVPVEHGWRPVSLPLLVTRVDGSVVHEIAGRPALEIWREHFDHEPIDEKLRTSRFAGYHSAHAFGLIEPDGTELIRGVFVDGADRLRTFTPLPPYSAVQIVTCGQDDLLGITDRVVARSAGSPAAAHRRHEPSVLLVFSCVARLDILRERGAEEARRLQTAAGALPTFGFYTYGEFARTTGVAGYHNATVAAIAL